MEKKPTENEFSISMFRSLGTVVLSFAALIVLLWIVISIVALISTVKF